MLKKQAEMSRVGSEKSVVQPDSMFENLVDKLQAKASSVALPASKITTAEKIEHKNTTLKTRLIEKIHHAKKFSKI